jgi:hypothetical protein
MEVVVSRIRLTAVLTAGVLAVGATAAGAVPAAKKAAKPKPKKVAMTCTTVLAEQIGADQTSVNPADMSGAYFGMTKCGGKRLRGGVEVATFTIPDDGSIHAKYTQFFSDGSVRGVFVLTPGDSQPTDQKNFSYQHFTGTLTVTGGTGADKGLKGARVGKLSCSTTDTIHLTCLEHIKVVLPAAT